MRLPLLTATVIAVGAPGMAAPMHFSLTIAGLTLGTLTVAASEDGAAYEASTRFETAGFAGLLDYRFDGSTFGLVGTGDALTPVRFTATTRSPRALRHTRIDWSDGAPALVDVEPPRETSVEPAAAAGALDPVTALVGLFGDTTVSGACASETDIFDGSRLVRLTLGPPVKSGDKLICEGDYRRLGGEPLTPIDPPECPFEIIYRTGSDETASLEQLLVPTRFGQARIARTD